jgi:hypothetical protein
MNYLISLFDALIIALMMWKLNKYKSYRGGSKGRACSNCFGLFSGGAQRSDCSENSFAGRDGSIMVQAVS